MVADPSIGRGEYAREVPKYESRSHGRDSEYCAAEHVRECRRFQRCRSLLYSNREGEERREANDQIKKMQKEGFAEDEAKNLENEIQKLTEKFIKQVDGIAEAKEKEIMTI